MQIRKAVIIAGLGALLSACQTSSDPTQGGLFGGVSGMASGAYDKRIQDRNQNLENEQDRNVAMTRENQRLDQQQVATKAKLTRHEQDYAVLSDGIKALERKLASVKGENNDLKRRAQELQQQIDLVQNDPFADGTAKRKKLEALRSEYDTLQAEINLALE